MGIRETINQNQGATAGVAIGIIVLALGFVVWNQCSSSSVGPGDYSGKVYYTTDNGATWFTDDPAKPVPFTKDGKEAVLVHLVACKGEEGTKTVWYLERLTPRAKADFEKMQASMPKDGPPPTSMGIEYFEGEIKRPSDPKWYARGVMGTPTRDQAMLEQIYNNKPCPHGGKHPQNEIFEAYPKKGE